MAYTSADSGMANYDNASKANYNANSLIGDALSETSTAGAGSTSWYDDISSFAGYADVILLRGGNWSTNFSAGLFSFNRLSGTGHLIVGFRSVLVAK
jgi:hypothetical protein